MRASAHRQPPFMDAAEFLQWDGDEHCELVEGELRAMAPAGTRHRLIQTRLAALPTPHLDDIGSPCRAMVEAGAISRVRANLNFRIPDLGVTGTPEGDQTNVSEPVLPIEVLSPGNASDTRQNIWTCTTTPSAREIPIVHTARVKAGLLRRRDDASWPERAEEIGPDGTVALESVGFKVPIVALCAGTKRAPTQPGT